MERPADGGRQSADAKRSSRIRWRTSLYAFGQLVRRSIGLSLSQFCDDQSRALAINWLTKVGGGMELHSDRLKVTRIGVLYLNCVSVARQYAFDRKVSSLSVSLYFRFL